MSDFTDLEPMPMPFEPRREDAVARNTALGLTIAPESTVRWAGGMQVQISAAKAKLAEGKKSSGKLLADALAAHMPTQPAASQSASDEAHAAMDDFNFGFDSPPAKADPVPDQAPAEASYLADSPELSFLTGEAAFDEPAASDPVTDSDAEGEEDPFAALDAPPPGIPASNKIPQRVTMAFDQPRPKQSIGDSMAKLTAIRKRSSGSSGSGSDPT